MKTALLSAAIYTADPDRPKAQALLIENNTITAVGTNVEIKAKAGSDCREIDLEGRFVCPGFVDAHTHACFMGQNLSQVDLRGKPSLAACLSAIAEAAKDIPKGQWILGFNWNQNIWEEGRDPDRHDLDRILPDHPAIMSRICGHAVWGNTLALKAAGIGPDTPEPEGGQIDREADGKTPSGMVREAVELLMQAVPAPTAEEIKQRFLVAQDEFIANGITAIHSFEGLAEFQAIRELQQEGKLKLRVYHSLPVEELDAFDAWNQENDALSPMLGHGHVKMFADGSLGAQTAFLHEPYEESDRCGIACLTPEQMQADIEAAYKRGRSVIIHAIGDRAVTQAVDAIEGARKNVPGERRDRIEHVQLCRVADLERMKAMGIAASVQPMALHTDGEVALKVWGEDRCRRGGYVWKTMQDLGLRMLFSSDAPIERISVVEGIQSAVTRQDFNEPPAEPWFGDQCISLESALCTYFKQAPWVCGLDGRLGMIREGFLADLTVLEQNPFEVDVRAIRTIPVTRTIINGVTA